MVSQEDQNLESMLFGPFSVGGGGWTWGDEPVLLLESQTGRAEDRREDRQGGR